jgi:hypothetical protein
MVGMHGRHVVRILGTVCVGASLLVGGSFPAAVTGSTAAIESGGATASAPMLLRASRNHPSPGYKFGLSKEEQDYIYQTGDLPNTVRDIRIHSSGRNFAS